MQQGSPSNAPTAVKSGAARRPPAALLLSLERRAPWEHAALLANRHWLRRRPCGDGRPGFILSGRGDNGLRPARCGAFSAGSATRCVTTLGIPSTGHPRATNAWRVAELLSGQAMNDNASIIERMRQESPVPTTSIGLRSDGIVSWRCSVVEPGPLAENIAVQASHRGLGLNPLALGAIADRLSQPAGGWKPFEPPAALRWLFDSPDIALAA